MIKINKYIFISLFSSSFLTLPFGLWSYIFFPLAFIANTFLNYRVKKWVFDKKFFIAFFLFVTFILIASFFYGIPNRVLLFCLIVSCFILLIPISKVSFNQVSNAIIFSVALVCLLNIPSLFELVDYDYKKYGFQAVNQNFLGYTVRVLIIKNTTDLTGLTLIASSLLIIKDRQLNYEKCLLLLFGSFIFLTGKYFDFFIFLFQILFIKTLIKNKLILSIFWKFIFFLPFMLMILYTLFNFYDYHPSSTLEASIGLNNRNAIWTQTFHSILNLNWLNIFFGSGPSIDFLSPHMSHLTERWPEVDEKKIFLHSTNIQIFHDFGIVGLVLYFNIYKFLFSKHNKTSVILIVFLLSSVLETRFYLNSIILTIIWVILVIYIGHFRKYRFRL